MRRLLTFLCLAALTLSACARPDPQVDPRTVLTRAALDAIETPLILAILPQQGLFSSLNLLTVNGGVGTWTTPDEITVSFRDGVLVSTRGLGQDMMTSDMSGTLAALNGRASGYYRRFQGTLDGQSGIDYRTFQCRVASRAPETIVIVERAQATTRTEEACASPGLEVTNVYWRGSDGVMWKSRQWINEDIGYLETERLVR